MGAGRRTSTYDIDTGAQQLGFVERQRNLGENLGGVIFGMPIYRTPLQPPSLFYLDQFALPIQVVVTKRTMNASAASSLGYLGPISVMCNILFRGKFIGAPLPSCSLSPAN